MATFLLLLTAAADPLTGTNQPVWTLSTPPLSASVKQAGGRGSLDHWARKQSEPSPLFFCFLFILKSTTSLEVQEPADAPKEMLHLLRHGAECIRGIAPRFRPRCCSRLMGSPLFLISVRSLPFLALFFYSFPHPSVSAVLTHRLAELGGALLSDGGATKGLINQARPKYKTIRSSDAANLIWEV